MIVKLEPASSDHRVWKICVPDEDREVPVDFTRVRDEARTFLGEGGYFDAEPDADGWTIVAKAPEPYRAAARVDETADPSLDGPDPADGPILPTDALGG